MFLQKTFNEKLPKSSNILTFYQYSYDLHHLKMQTLYCQSITASLQLAATV